ncbi:uncharacterized protein LOC106159480 isoform X2 [Lingula anatina]|nr:uncharacterized protein LOC106159480 isoform X2 [Lingula anatina]XP_013391230.1 uncharacterized protein LOC106159480 isoform X2 [Lingula anatina]|eukprot:XP_013391229.1 uncharacterized protein LOC106159480 isoform X2 [Lingula anatina]
MACSDIIKISTEHADGEERYYVPEDRLPSLCVDTGGASAVWLYGLPVFANVQHQLEECFRADGPQGIPYEPYKELIQVRSKLFAGRFWPNLMKQLADNIPSLTSKLETGASILEIGCGSGDFMKTFARKFTKSQFFGIDSCSEAIKYASETAANDKISNVAFAEKDGQNLPSDWSGMYDYVITVKVIHDATDPKKMLSEIKRVLKPDGLASIIDLPMRSKVSENLHSPITNTVYTAGLFHCIPSSMFYGGPGLGPCWGVENMEELLATAGFKVKTILNEQIAHYVCTDK